MIGQRIERTLPGDIRISSLEDVQPNSDEQLTPIFFLHGWGGSAESFQPLWEWCREYGCMQSFYALDFPGFGHSTPPASAWSIEEYAKCVVQYMDALHLTTVDLVSHSFGGRVTTKLLALYPNRFRKIVYVAPAGIRHHQKEKDFLGKIIHTVKPFLELPLINTIFSPVKRFIYRLAGNHDYAQLSGVMKETYQRVVTEDLSPLLPRIAHPVLIFWGTQDSYVPVADAEYMKTQLQHASVVLFPDGRHGIHTTHASDIGARMQTFFSDNSL